MADAHDETSIGGPHTRFQSTLWSLIEEAKSGSPESLERLLADYWKPVYFFIRRRGHDVEDAKDLTQSFLESMLERDFLKGVSPGLGRFRSFVMACVTNFLSNHRDRLQARKRGGGINVIHAEIQLASADPGPELAFKKAWALETMERAVTRLRSLVSPEDMDLLGGASPPGLSPSQKKGRLHRVRKHLRECLRDEIRGLVDRESEIDSEFRELFAALA
jgi:RNA polymerase sigma-70 factor (ECF subfamily)